MEDASERGVYPGRVMIHVDQLCSVSDGWFQSMLSL